MVNCDIFLEIKCAYTGCPHKRVLAWVTLLLLITYYYRKKVA